MNEPANTIPANAEAADAPAHGEGSVTELVRRLHDGRARVADLSLVRRRQCVDHLTQEGFTTHEVTELMGLSERTVRRDRAAIRREYAQPPDDKLGDELLGELRRSTRASIQRLVRLVREPDTPPYARLWAEEAIARMQHRLLDTARRMGYFTDGEERLEDQQGLEVFERLAQEYAKLDREAETPSDAGHAPGQRDVHTRDTNYPYPSDPQAQHG